MANIKNEVTIKLGSNTYKLRASMNAVYEIEERFNKSLAELTLLELANYKIRSDGLRAILIAGIRGADGVIDEEQIDSDIEQHGIAGTTNEISVFLTQAFSGSPVSPANKKK